MSRRVGGADAKRIGKAVSFPGIDPRTWISAARVELDPDSLRWDAALGWVVDVRAYGGELEGETDIVCRVASALGGPGAGAYAPPILDAEAIVALPSGDPEVNPVVLGWLNSEGGNEAPATVNGLPIVGELETSTPLSVSPFDTEIHVSPHALRSERAGLEHRQAASHVIAGDDAMDAVLLGSEDASAPFVKGDGLVTQLDTFITALLTALAAISAATTPPTTSAVDTLTQKYTTEIKPLLFAPGGPVLSARVKGE